MINKKESKIKKTQKEHGSGHYPKKHHNHNNSIYKSGILMITSWELFSLIEMPNWPLFKKE